MRSFRQDCTSARVLLIHCPAEGVLPYLSPDGDQIAFRAEDVIVAAALPEPALEPPSIRIMGAREGKASLRKVEPPPDTRRVL
jgi:hypothetical protein